MGPLPHWELNDNNNNNPQNSQVLDPYFVTGFVDGEGYFVVSVRQSNKMKTGWLVELIFGINLHGKDEALLQQIKSYLGVGRVNYRSDGAASYQVSSRPAVFLLDPCQGQAKKTIKNLAVIIEFFDKYPLISKKKSDFELFKQAYLIVKGKDHLMAEGLQQIVSIRASLNKGLTDKLRDHFPNTTFYPKPLTTSNAIPSPNWISGFVAAEGCFRVDSFTSVNKVGFTVVLNFYITQHVRDTELMLNIGKYLDCGYLKNGSDNQDWCNYVVKSFSDINEKIIPFFINYPIRGEKVKDFEDFKRVAEIMANRGHLSQEGLAKILKIKQGMNRARSKA